MKKASIVLVGFVAAGALLGAGPAPKPTGNPPVSVCCLSGFNGKDWTAPNGPLHP